MSIHNMHISKRGQKEPELDLDLFDVMAYLDDRGIDYANAGSKNVSVGWIGISCVYCGDHSTHLGINLETKQFSCFKCGTKGNAVKLVAELDRSSFSRAKETINKFISADLSYLVRRVRTHSHITMFPGNTSDNFLPIHDKFIKSRRYDRDFLQRKYDIMAVGPTCDDWKFRIIIPVYLNGEIVTYLGRDVTGKAEIPYKNAPVERSIIQAKHTLYNIDSVKDTAIIVEGVLDAWRIGNFAIPTFGTQYSTEQLRLLNDKRLKKIFVLYDSDAISEAEKLAYDVSAICSSVEIVELSEGDPDSLSEDEAWQLRRDLLGG
jgi:DNA primase